MLDVVEADGLSVDLHELPSPGALAEQPRRDRDVANALDRMMVQNDPDGQRVVEIDPEGELLVASEAADRRLLERTEVGVEATSISGRHAGVGHTVDAVVSDHHVTFEEGRPRRVVDGSGALLVVRLPVHPQLCTGRTEGARRRQQERSPQRDRVHPRASPSHDSSDPHELIPREPSRTSPHLSGYVPVPPPRLQKR